MFTKKQFYIVSITAVVLFLICAVSYAYEKLEGQIRATDATLVATQNQLAVLEASTTLAIKNQSSLITTQKESLAKSQSNQTTLQNELESFQNSTEAVEKSFVTNVNKIAPSVVELVCRGDAKAIYSKVPEFYTVQVSPKSRILFRRTCTLSLRPTEVLPPVSSLSIPIIPIRHCISFFKVAVCSNPFPLRTWLLSRRKSLPPILTREALPTLNNIL